MRASALATGDAGGPERPKSDGKFTRTRMFIPGQTRDGQASRCRAAIKMRVHDKVRADPHATRFSPSRRAPRGNGAARALVLPTVDPLPGLLRNKSLSRPFAIANRSKMGPGRVREIYRRPAVGGARRRGDAPRRRPRRLGRLRQGLVDHPRRRHAFGARRGIRGGRERLAARGRRLRQAVSHAGFLPGGGLVRRTVDGRPVAELPGSEDRSLRSTSTRCGC